MKTSIGRLGVTLAPIYGSGNRTRMVELSRKFARTDQTWHCHTRRRNPDPPKRSMDVETNLLFLSYRADGSADRQAGNQLAAKFLRNTGFRNFTALDKALQRQFGKKTGITIPYDRLMLPNRDDNSYMLRSSANYAELLVTFPGLAPHEDVVLSVPTFLYHQRFLIGVCEGTQHVPFSVLESIQQATFTSEKAPIKPHPKDGTEAIRSFYRHLIAYARRERLELFLADAQAELATLTGN